MVKRVAWSISSLDDFAGCPKRYYLTRVTKQVRQAETVQMLAGKNDHKSLEDRLLLKTPLPPHLVKYEPLVSVLERRKGILLAEQQLCLNADFKPTTWFGKDAWVRAILDGAIINKSKAFVFDWKTGKRKPDSEQLKLFAAMTFAHYPKVEVVRTSFFWLKTQETDDDVFTRDQVPEIWDGFLARVARLEHAYAKNAWPARPTGLCGWCPASKAQCDFAKDRR